MNFNSPFIFFVILGSAYVLAIVLITVFYVKHKNKKVKEKIKKTFAELEEPKKEEKKKENLDSILDKMEADLEKKEDEIRTFEDDQEENAIISYQELVQAVNKKKESNIANTKELHEVTKKQNLDNTRELQERIRKQQSLEIPDYKEEIEEYNKPIKEYKEEYSKPVKEEYKEIPEVKEPVREVKKETKKFKQTEFISPIYGKQEIKEEQRNYQTEIVEVEEDEEKMNDDFLNSLKNLRRNL